VGAGPAGPVLAYLLHRNAIPFVVFERKPHAELCRLPKAGPIEHRTVRLLEREDIAPSVLDFCVENSRCEYRAPRRITGSVVRGVDWRTVALHISAASAGATALRCADCRGRSGAV
jgi:2-polyprenyl-6-methoxyphenol hydroxylase-like FAD-dependent oxidoreductase